MFLMLQFSLNVPDRIDINVFFICRKHSAHLQLQVQYALGGNRKVVRMKIKIYDMRELPGLQTERKENIHLSQEMQFVSKLVSLPT